MNERNCCNGQCNQGRDCTARKVIEFQARAGLHRFCAPPDSNSSGSVWIDLLTFWHVKLPHINWGPLFGLVLIAVCGALVAAGIYGFAASIDWGHVLGAMWGAR